jgi:glycine amidinotransferase
MLPVRPGLAIYNPEWPPITEEFWKLFKMNDWELIPAARPVYVHKAGCRLFGPYGDTSWISMNTFSLGPNTICVEAHETGYIEQLDKLGVEVVPIPYEHVIPFGGALHCTTLDVYREGDCEDYFVPMTSLPVYFGQNTT